MYGAGSPFGRGMYDNHNFIYGHYSGASYGPIGGPAMNGNGGSIPQWIDPRGFNMDWNRTKEVDLGNPRGILPGFGKPMFPGSPFPARFEQGNGVNQFGTPPFTGRAVSSLGPNGPFVIEGLEDVTGNKRKMNTTLMGPLPFGPYGGGPYQPFTGGQLPMGGMGGGGMMPSMNPMMMSGGAMMGGQAMMGAGGMYPGGSSAYPTVGTIGQTPVPGLHPTSNPFTVLHHASMFPNQGSGMAPSPGLVSSFGQGYPHPDFDRYHSVAAIPPGPFGGGMEAAAAA
jgi:hypothetical protein